MTAFGPTLLVLAAQVTLPVLGGLLLSRRRDPAAACGPLVVAAAAALLLTPLAFLPRPDWPACDRPGVLPTEVAASEGASPAGVAPSPGGIDVLKLLRMGQSEASAPPATGFDAWRAVAFVILGLAGLGLGRFAVGLAHTTRVVRAARPVRDPDLIALADELRLTLGCRAAVELRESARVGTAAAAGWRRPVILVASAWRQWSAGERRASLRARDQRAAPPPPWPRVARSSRQSP